MSRTIAVIGATGTQGGSVTTKLLESKQWRVRAITRDRMSRAARVLATAGADVVIADINDEESLVKVFDGVDAVFAVTDFRQHLISAPSRTEAGEREMEQGINIARAAARTESLQHYVWSTSVPAADMTGGKFPSPHMDYKAKVSDFIREELPDLAGKTTFVLMGWYPSNLAFFPHMRPMALAGGSNYIWPQPCSASTMLPVIGDPRVNPGVWVRQILAHPNETKGKYITVATETLSVGDILKTWSEITGKEAIHLTISSEEYGRMWGVAGVELASQLKFNEAVPDWKVFREKDFIAPEEINVDSEETVGLRQTLETLQDKLL